MDKASEKSILIVDDEPDVRNFLKACLEDAGFKVDTAVDGVDAFEKVQESTPDLLTVDMVMPRRSGISLIRKLRKHKDYADIPIIVITAHAHDEFGKDEMKKFDGFSTHHSPRHILEKPVTPESIVKTICDILDVETEDVQFSGSAAGSGDRDDIINLIKSTDPETLKKVRDALKNA